MTEAEETLTAAVTKASKNGWLCPVPNFKEVEYHGGTAPVCLRGEGMHVMALNSLLYDHDFAKALWGEYPDIEVHMMPVIDFGITEGRTITAIANPTHNYKKWQYHLQQMVIADDPIKYLGANT